MRHGKYQIFVRNFYRYDGTKDWQGRRNIVPGLGRKTIIGYEDDIHEARRICNEYNSTHKPGPLSRKCEFTSDW